MINNVKSREIDYLWHFTRIENITAILQEGLKSRLKLESRPHQPVFNDQYRLDGQRDSICCSIDHPNYKMFYALRQENADQEWVVVGIDPSILWEKDCAFCSENAASNNVTNIPIEERKGVVAFNMMFNEIQGKPSREVLGIPKSCPTNPQAEVLVFNDIEPRYIEGAVFQTNNKVDEYSQLFPDFQIVYHRAHFMPRMDWRHW